MDPLEHLLQLWQVHRLLEAVAHGLTDERVIRNLTVAGNVLEAGGSIRKYRRHEIVGLHALQLRRHFSSATIARDGKRDRRIPAPASLKDRRIEKRLHQDVAHRCRVEISKDVGKRERVLWSQREQQGVLGRGCLQLEIELTAESLAKSQRPGLVHAAAERRMQHELHAPSLVEKALDDERGLGRDGT